MSFSASISGVKPPPAKPFAIAFISCFAIFVVWGIVGSILEPMITDPTEQQRIGKIVLPIAFALFLIMGFSAVPVMARVFFKLFFGMQKARGGREQPVGKRLQANWETLAAVFVYVAWAIFALGTLIGAPFFFMDMLKGS
jgi:hypothetical protein